RYNSEDKIINTCYNQKNLFNTLSFFYNRIFRFFRLILCDDFLNNFSSDRSHMIAEDGSWMAPPPSWDKICREGLNNISDFISMDQNTLSDISNVLSEDEMLRKFSVRKHLIVNCVDS
ncbi:unnamed protein product, partial [Strongylus vulgaris]